MIIDPVSLLSSLGALGIFLVLFAETGLLIGFFLPGDSLLFTAGILAATDAHSALHMALPVVMTSAAAGAILGAQFGFVLGRRGGRALLRHTRNRHLHAGVRRGSVLLGGYGHGKAIVLARFIPVVRTIVNPLAGLSDVPVRTFVLWQVLGGLLWTVTVTLTGYFLGNVIPNVDQYLFPVIVAVVVISLIPVGARQLGSRGGPSPVSPLPTPQRWNDLT